MALVAVVAASAVSATTAPAASMRPAKAAAPTIHIAVIDSMSGALANPCLDEYKAETLAVKMAIAKTEKVTVKAGKKRKVVTRPWLGGVSIAVDAHDDTSTAAGGVTAFANTLDSPAVAIVGPCSSGVAAAYYQNVDGAKIPNVISTAGVAGFVAPQWVYRAGLPQPYFDGRAVIAMKKNFKVKTVYVIHEDDSPTIASVWKDVFKRGFASVGIKVVGDYSTTIKTQDLSPAIEQIRRLKPDAVGILVNTVFNIPYLTQLRTSGLTQLFFGQAGMEAPEVLAKGAPNQNLLFPTNYFPGSPYPSAVAFTKAYRNAYDRDPSWVSADGFDAMQRVLQAIHDIGPAKVANADKATARLLVKQALDRQKKVLGAQGPLTFSADGDSRGPALVVYVSQQNVVTVLGNTSTRVK